MESKLSRSVFEAIRGEIKKVIVGHDYLIERLLVALIADGHILIEGVPGLAKTKILSALCSTLDGSISRVQFTPDLLPSDLIGTEVYRPQSGEFIIRKGPIFTNLLLADEINRAPAKVQSALLQAMQEREVTIGEQTFALPSPFLVFATQNPIEQEGTYPLPEAQVDRFLMKVRVGYPTPQEEISILSIATPEKDALQSISHVCSLQDVLSLRRSATETFIDSKIDSYIVSIVHSSRDVSPFGLKGMVDWGASPRASLALKVSARALAFIRGDQFVTPDHIKEVAPDVLRHRILTSFEAEAKGVTSDDIIRVILKSISIP